MVRQAFHTLQRRGRSFIAGFKSTREPTLIVLGNQKSGTTAIAALLATFAGLTKTLDLLPPPASLLRDIHTAASPFEKIVASYRWEFSQHLVKEPGLTFLFPQVASRFPRTSFLMIVRDPRDNIRSILNRLKIPGSLDTIDLDAYKEVSPIWRQIIDGRWMGLQGNTYIELLSARWNRAADVYLKHSHAMHLVRYEDFLIDKEGTIAALARHLGLAQVNDISNKVDVQFQPAGNREVVWDDFFGSINLARINQLCCSRMVQFGYPIDAKQIIVPPRTRADREAHPANVS